MASDRQITVVSGVVMLVLVVAFVIAANRQDKREKEEAQAAAVAQAERAKQDAVKAKEEEAACRPNLRCWAEKNRVDAEVACERQVERLAKYRSEWTDSWPESKFPVYRWKDRERGVITYIGDKIRFQNGFGAWATMKYECDFDTAIEKVLAVRAEAGRLPR